MNNSLFFQLRRLSYTAASLTAPLFRPPVTIFCYHGLAQDNWRFNLSPDQFARQLNYLLAHYQLISLSSLSSYLSGQLTFSRPAAVLTFDDGYQNLFSTQSIFAPLIVKPTIFALADPAHANRSEMENPYPLLTPTQLKHLFTSGWTIGSHGSTHADFYHLSTSQLVSEVKASKLRLEKLLGHPVNYFAYPKGAYTPAVVEAVKQAGYRLGLSMDPGIVTPSSSPFTLPRVGIDRSHTFREFIAAPTYPAVLLRHLFGHSSLVT